MRESDWIESADMCRQLQESGDYGMLIATEHMARLFVGWRPPTAHQVCFAQTHCAKPEWLNATCCRNQCLNVPLNHDVHAQVGQWFGQRALEVDTRSGQLSCAGAVLQLSGRADAPQTVRNMQDAVHSLRDIVQSGAHRPISPTKPRSTRVTIMHKGSSLGMLNSYECLI